MKPGDLHRGAGCPDLDALQAAASDEIRAHLAECPACRAELALFRSFEAPNPGNAEQADVSWIAARLEKARPGLPARQSWWSVLKTPKLALAATCLLLVATVAVQWNARRMTPLDQGGATAENLRSAGALEWIEAPAGDIASGDSPRHLRWTPVTGATYYAELLEVDGTVAWKSGTISGNSLDLPEEARRKMEARRKFMLRVTATDGSGRVMAVTPATSFRIVPDGATPTR